MTEEKGVVEETPTIEAETVAVPTETNEQTEQPVEGVTPPVDGKDYKAIAEQLSKDIKEKNRKIQELKSTPVPTAPVQPVISEDETVRRFLQTEANATIAVKLQTDPSFKDRVELVQEYVKQGYDINMADKLAKADIMDKILSAKSETETPVIPNQIKPTATQEQVAPQPTGNSLDDIQSGKVSLGMEDEAALREVLKKYRPA